MVIPGFSKVFMFVSRVFQGYFKGVSRKFQESFKTVSRVFQVGFEGVLTPSNQGLGEVGYP